MSTPLFPFTWQYSNQPIEVLANNVNLLLPECNDSNKYTTNVTPGIPWFIYPTLINTCTKVEDLNTIDPNLPVENLSGWKIGGHLVLQNSDSYTVSLGTLTVEDSFSLSNQGFYPWKTSGTTSAQIPTTFNMVTEPLGLFNTATDSGTVSGINYVQVRFTYTPTYPVTGDTVTYALELTVERCSISETATPPTAELEIAISFEFEFLINNVCTVTYTL
jgi:hypothetical protein